MSQVTRESINEDLDSLVQILCVNAHIISINFTMANKCTCFEPAVGDNYGPIYNIHADHKQHAHNTLQPTLLQMAC